ncbi:MAG TPA: hypothetical protein VFG21_08145 [Xanthomonadaceae bacterium]|nr:hypothetical protein [Xanthomonadaceae bacterium]
MSRMAGKSKSTGMSREALVARLQELIHQNRQARDPERDAANGSPLLAPLQRWQSRRLAAEFQDLLEARDSAHATGFFLSDLYGDHDVSTRDRDIERVLPMMQNLLPPPLLQVAADAIELAMLSHSLDLDMVRALEQAGVRDGDRIDARRYSTAYRQIPGTSRRGRQLELIGTVGHELAELIRSPWVMRMLRVARTPARMAGLGELQSFLERGITAFARLRDAHRFVDTVVRRESETSRTLLAGSDVAEPPPPPPDPAVRTGPAGNP